LGIRKGRHAITLRFNGRETGKSEGILRYLYLDFGKREQWSLLRSLFLNRETIKETDSRWHLPTSVTQLKQK